MSGHRGCDGEGARLAHGHVAHEHAADAGHARSEVGERVARDLEHAPLSDDHLVPGAVDERAGGDLRRSIGWQVCNNLSLALKSKEIGTFFRRGHSLGVNALKAEYGEYFRTLLAKQNRQQEFRVQMSKTRCDEQTFADFLKRLLPDPKMPVTAMSNRSVLMVFEIRRERVRQVRQETSTIEHIAASRWELALQVQPEKKLDGARLIR